MHWTTKSSSGHAVAAAMVLSMGLFAPVATTEAQAWNVNSGQSIDVSGSTVVMGEPRANGNDGAILVYEWDDATGQLAYLEMLAPPDPVQSSRLGWSVALDGDLLVGGAWNGWIVIFQRENDTWRHDATLNGSDYDGFGYSTDLSGTFLAVGSYEHAFIYERTDDEWLERQIVIDPGLHPSRSVAIDGDFAAACAYLSDETGPTPVVVLQRQGDIWVQHSTVPIADGSLSYPAFLDLDFPRLIVQFPSRPYVGSGTYVFEWSGSEWVQQGRVRSAVDVDINGDGSGGKSGGDRGIVWAYFGATGEDVVADVVLDGVVDLLDIGATATSRPCDFDYLSIANPTALIDGDRLAVISIPREFVEACDYEVVARIYDFVDGVWTLMNKFRLGDAGSVAVTLSGDYLIVNRVNQQPTVLEKVLDVRAQGFDPQHLSHTMVEVPIDWDAVADDDDANLAQPARCFDLQVVLADSQWTGTEAQLATDGALFQHPVGSDFEPYAALFDLFPALPYDCFFADPPVLFDGGVSGFALGPQWTDQSVDVVWFDVPLQHDSGTYAIARFTIMGGSEMTITGRSTSGTAEVDYPFSFTIDLDGCAGDVDGDGDTDQSDLGELLAAYSLGTDGGDLDGDGDTDQSDLGILLADYDCNVW